MSKMTYNRRWAGVCVGCGGARDCGLKYLCRACGDKKNEAQKVRRRHLVENSICVDCKQKIDYHIDLGTYRCLECRTYRRGGSFN